MIGKQSFVLFRIVCTELGIKDCFNQLLIENKERLRDVLKNRISYNIEGKLLVYNVLSELENDTKLQISKLCRK